MKTKSIISVLSSTFFIVLLTISCSSSNDDDLNPDPDPDPDPGEEVTYVDDVQPIIQSNCLSCHSDPPQNNAPMHLTTYNAVKQAVENRGLLTRINSTSSPMPPTGRMSQANRNIIEEWVDQGFIED
ncbi:hypothetical protein [Sinomicrobium weinanense]|uniref:Cytochrome c domain-containing protein n=1 Tax=Sinomicrobium weinanense TaxID=2842200 RepID=A0A926Q4K4_9FLAO|nr:hypothetical protein [Sinomicrobium weinanense]MBC9796990.1 hypothetical protein [Sinomicrobium weinanense]MBU3122171.1 hypothetical protein [Sinomicrobium weinanense]